MITKNGDGVKGNRYQLLHNLNRIINLHRGSRSRKFGDGETRAPESAYGDNERGSGSRLVGQKMIRLTMEGQVRGTKRMSLILTH